MTADLLLALVGFALVTSITPGPNNAMLLASGVNFGFRRSLPHMAGICAGCALMLPLVGLGLGGLFAAMPVLYVMLRYAGAAYLLVLAWKIARSGAPKPGGAAARPFGFMQALAFQFVNPKAWIMMVGAVTTYTPYGSYLRNIMIVTAVFALVMLPSIAVWAGCGVAMRRLLSNPARVRAFNITMALLLVASLYPLLGGIE
jgi:threonine/homoserine/homoserine lactone efflux protein